MIRELRKKQGLTLINLEELSGYSNAYLSQIENGKKKPTLKVLKSIQPYINVSLREILKHYDIPYHIYEDENESEIERLERENELLREKLESIKLILKGGNP